MAAPFRSHAPRVVLVVCALLWSLWPVAASAATDTTAESRLVSLIADARQQRGLPALRVSAELTAVARRHSARMADRGEVHHNDDLGGEVSGWRRIGENVGRGPDADAVHDAFMRSSSHRRNILDPGFREVGVGVERRGDTVWVTEVFRQPAGEPSDPPSERAEPTPTPASAEPAPTSSPAPSPEPDPASRPPRRDTPDTGPSPRVGTSPAAAARVPPADASPVVDRLTVHLARIESEERDVAVREALRGR